MLPHNRSPFGQVGQGPEVEALENELLRFRPGGRAVCVSSGTAALYLSMQALRMGSFKLPTYSCSSLLNAARMAGANVYLQDCDELTFNSSSEVYVHTYGVPVIGPKWAEHTIEDFTHAPGGLVGELPCGSHGELSVVSFGATKPLGAGAGGAILGPEKLIGEIRERRDYDARKGNGPWFNWQMSDVIASMVRTRLSRLDVDNAWRAETAALYESARATSKVGRQGMNIEGKRVWYRYVIRLRDIETAQARFRAAKVETIVPLTTGELLHRLTEGEPLRAAEEVAKTTLSLPIWPGMTSEDVRRVADVLADLGDLE